MEIFGLISCNFDCTTKKLSPSNSFTHSFNLHGLRLELGLLHSCLALNAIGFRSTLCLSLGLPGALHCCALGLQLQQVAARLLSLRFIHNLLALQAAPSLLLQSLRLVPVNAQEFCWNGTIL